MREAVAKTKRFVSDAANFHVLAARECQERTYNACGCVKTSVFVCQLSNNSNHTRYLQTSVLICFRDNPIYVFFLFCLCILSCPACQLLALQGNCHSKK